MTIAKRLTILLAVAMTSLLLIGGLGLMQFKRINDQVTTLADVSFPGVRLAGDIVAKYKDFQPIVLSLMAETDPDLQAGFMGSIRAAQVAIEQQLVAYQPYASSPTQKKLFDQVHVQLKAYLQAINDIAKLASAKKTDQAQEVLFTRVMPASQSIEALLNQIKADNVKSEVAGRQAVEKAYRQALWTFAIIISAALVILGMAGVMLYRSIVNPIQLLQKTIRDVASSLDLTKRVPVTSNDEIGSSLGAFNQLLEVLQTSLGEMIQAINSSVLASIEMHQASMSMAYTANEGSGAATLMSSVVDSMVTNIGTIAQQVADTNELTKQSGQIAVESEGIIGTTVREITGISGAITEASGRLNALQVSSQSISAVVGVIRDVADQTNLLALNAAIEAARAGEQGRGFAVVADEVRKLAERTAGSTKEIVRIVSDIQEGAKLAVANMQQVVKQVDEGVMHAEQAGEAVRQISMSATQVLGMVSTITEAIRNQDAASSDISNEVKKLGMRSEQTSVAAQDTAQFANQMRQLADNMSGIVSRFSVGIENAKVGASQGGDVDMF